MKKISAFGLKLLGRLDLALAAQQLCTYWVDYVYI